MGNHLKIILWSSFQSSCFAEESKEDGEINVNRTVWKAKRLSHHMGENRDLLPQEMKRGAHE